MNIISLNDIEQYVSDKESVTKESDATFQMIRAASTEIIRAAETSNKVTIFTDYDADGITSAYIMEKLVRSINPKCEVNVNCNDRRGSYGLSPTIQGNTDTRYIVLDMGSNQLDLARERLGQDVIILDHHLIEDENTRKSFMSLEPSANNSCLCNPHAFNLNDAENAQYCAAGLAYRAYQEAKALCEIYQKPFYTSEKQDNTVAVIACIGTATDMVNVLDEHGYNRDILKKGLQIIDNADETNLDFVVGHMLEMCGTSDGITAHQLAFNTGAFLNSASRMSEIIDDNGAQIMYNALTADENKADTYFELNRLMDYNHQRKALITQLTNEPAYEQFVYEHRFGKSAEDNIGVYQLPDDVPAAFAGLIAGKLAEAADKAIICITYSHEKGYYTGSGRNVPNNETALKTFMDTALQEEINSDSGFYISYGGHEDAIGISSLNDIVKFCELIQTAKENIKTKDSKDKTILAVSIDDFKKPETLERLQALEPTGIGFQLPSVQIDGIESYRNRLFKSNNEHWKTIRIKDNDTKAQIDIADWSYSPEKYPQTGKKGDEISLLAEIGISDYKGQHIELSAKFDRQFLKERVGQIEQEQAKSDPQANQNPELS